MRCVMVAVLVVVVLLCTSTAFSENKVVVIPIISGEKASTVCSGTMNGTRWCDNGDGTVTDMTNGLVWLQNANCFDRIIWMDSTDWIDAHSTVGHVYDNGPNDCGLSDGSTEGEWRLPTKKELVNLVNGVEAVRSDTPRAFNNVVANIYWTSSTVLLNPGKIWTVYLKLGNAFISESRTDTHLILPVRSVQ